MYQNLSGYEDEAVKFRNIKLTNLNIFTKFVTVFSSPSSQSSSYTLAIVLSEDVSTINQSRMDFCLFCFFHFN